MGFSFFSCASHAISKLEILSLRSERERERLRELKIGLFCVSLKRMESLLRKDRGYVLLRS